MSYWKLARIKKLREHQHPQAPSQGIRAANSSGEETAGAACQLEEAPGLQLL